MFENLQEKLQRAFKTLRGQATLSEENIQEALRQIRLALLEADVNFKVVKQLIDQIQAKAVGQNGAGRRGRAAPSRVRPVPGQRRAPRARAAPRGRVALPPGAPRRGDHRRGRSE